MSLHLWAKVVVILAPLLAGLFLAWCLWGSLTSRIEKLQAENTKVKEKIARRRRKLDGLSDQRPPSRPDTETEEPAANEASIEIEISLEEPHDDGDDASLRRLREESFVTRREERPKRRRSSRKV